MIKILKFIALLLLITSCTNTKSIKYDTVNRSPKDANYEMEIIDKSDIERDYKVIGEISIKASNLTSTKKMLEKIKDRAKKMGADAIIDLTTGSIGSGSFNGTTGVYSEDSKQLWKAKVIVWE